MATNEENQKKLAEVMEILGMMIEDRELPNNIHEIAKKCVDRIKKVDKKDNTPGIVASLSISSLEELLQDLNCPYHTRTQIYHILSRLEQVRD